MRHSLRNQFSLLSVPGQIVLKQWEETAFMSMAYSRDMRVNFVRTRNLEQVVDHYLESGEPLVFIW